MKAFHLFLSACQKIWRHAKYECVCIGCAAVLLVVWFCIPSRDEFKTDAVKDVLKDNHLPVVYIHIDETAEGYGTLAQMHESEDHSVRCTGKMKIDVPDGYTGEFSSTALPDSGVLALEYIRGRGHSTWSAEKKPYKFKLRKSADLLGMDHNKHWILLASRFDNTLIRTRVTSYISRRMGMEYTIKGAPVDLVINGVYYGSYFLCEQVRLGASRVAIDELQNTDNREPAVTGGYLLALRPFDNDPQWKTRHGTAFGFVAPTFADGDGTPEQKAYICDYLQKVEDAVYGEDFRDKSGQSVFDYMDMQSTADFWWMQEFLDNVDAYITPSNYLYKKRDGKLFWGPLWDFDNSVTGRNGYDAPFNNSNFEWIDLLRAYYPAFQQMLKERWKVLDGIITDLIEDGGVIDQYAAEVRASWKDDVRLYPNDHFLEIERSDYDEEIARMKSILRSRRDWIRENLDKEIPHVYQSIRFMADGKLMAEEKVAYGQISGQVPIAPEKKGYVFKEWRTEDGAAFEDYEVITEDITVHAFYLKDADAKKIRHIYFGNTTFCTALSEGEFSSEYAAMPEDADEKTLHWTSSDPAVATVDERGKVTLKQAGSVTIKAATKFGVANSYVLVVSGDGSDPLPTAESLSVKQKKVTMKPGEYLQILPSASPAASRTEYMFSSTEWEVADVNSQGVVIAAKKGTTEIIITDVVSELQVKYTVVVTGAKKSR